MAQGKKRRVGALAGHLSFCACAGKAHNEIQNERMNFPPDTSAAEEKGGAKATGGYVTTVANNITHRQRRGL